MPLVTSYAAGRRNIHGGRFQVGKPSRATAHRRALTHDDQYPSLVAEMARSRRSTFFHGSRAHVHAEWPDIQESRHRVVVRLLPASHESRRDDMLQAGVV
jgi:hypothetical protein